MTASPCGLKMRINIEKAILYQSGGKKRSKPAVFLVFLLVFGENLIISVLMSASSPKVGPEKMEKRSLVRSQSALCGH